MLNASDVTAEAFPGDQITCFYNSGFILTFCGMLVDILASDRVKVTVLNMCGPYKIRPNRDFKGFKILMIGKLLRNKYGICSN